MYAVENEKTYGDFIAIILKDGYVELRYSVAGSKTLYTSSIHRKAYTRNS